MSFLLVLNLVEWGIRLVMIPVILRRRFNPTTALAWLTVIMFVPELGLLGYLVFGAERLSRRRVKVLAKVRAHVQARLADRARPPGDRPDLGEVYEQVVILAERIGGMPIVGGNHVELLSQTEQFISQLLADIEAAEHHVHLLFYIYEADETGERVTEALIRAAKRGVTCRVLADHVGSIYLFKRGGQADRLNDAGVKTLPMLPVNPLRRGLHRIDVRNHRKLVVIDGRVGYTGSQNVVNPTFGHKRAGVWHDMSGRFTGPVVAQLQEVFVQDWAVETNEVLDAPDLFPSLEPAGTMYAQVVPTGPTDTSRSIVPQMVLAAINASREHLLLTTPYFAPDEPTQSALVMAAARGVRTELVLPSRSDHPTVLAAGRFYYDMLLEAGITVYEHTEGLLHAKTMTVDDAFGLLGSTNVDMRSFHLNYEMNVLLYGDPITQHLRFAQQRYINESVQIGPAAWRARPAWRRYGQSAAALLTPLL